MLRGTQNTEPMKWAEVREHYMRCYKPRTQQFTQYWCSHCRQEFTIWGHGTKHALALLGHHLTEQHADKLKQGE